MWCGVSVSGWAGEYNTQQYQGSLLPPKVSRDLNETGTDVKRMEKGIGCVSENEMFPCQGKLCKG